MHPCTTCTVVRASMLSERAYDERDFGKSGEGVYKVGEARTSDYLLRTNDEHNMIQVESYTQHRRKPRRPVFVL